MLIFFSFVFILAFGVPCLAAEGAQPVVVESDAAGRTLLSVVVYNNGLALVREERRVPVTPGEFELRFSDVSRSLLPNSVVCRPGERAKVKILEQRYHYDLISTRSLLERYLGRKVILERKDERTKTVEEVEAELLSLEGGRVFRIGGRIEIDPPGRLILPEVPDGLAVGPTLAWLMRGKRKGKIPLEVSYLTGGISWNCDYVLTLSGETGTAMLAGWVSLDNQSGTAYPDCDLTLVAGDVSRVPQPRFRRGVMLSKAGPQPEMDVAAGQDEGFQRRDLADYHRYSLGRRTSLDNRQAKQIELFRLEGLKIERRYRLKSGGNFFYSRAPRPRRNLRPALYLEWENGGGNYPGMPLPAGTVRVYRQEPGGETFFLGEDRITHIPQQEKASILAGKVFDLVAERRQMDFRKLSSRQRQVSIEITLTNRKTRDVTVELEEHLPGDWQMIGHSHEFEPIDAGTVRFSPQVKAGGKVIVKYTIKFI